MFSKLKVGDKVYVAYGGGVSCKSYHYSLTKVKRITPKKKLIVVGYNHFYSDTGKCTNSETTLHLELFTPELETELTQKKEIHNFVFKLLDEKPTYDQMLKMKEIMGWEGPIQRKPYKPKYSCVEEE